jgi:two-component system sensor histidine kinase/response regulator
VLVVDDNAFNREVVSDFLIAVGMVVETAVNGRDALMQLEKADYDVVLMDMHMPEVDGLTATREIRLHSRWSRLPIIALTAQARIEDRNASLAAGMTAHLTKPIDEAVLYKTLIDVLDGTSTSESGEASRETGMIASHDPDILAALRRLGGNRDRLLRLVHGFLRDYADASEQMKVSLETGDIAKVAALAHMMKGAASYFDARELCDVAELLEIAAVSGHLDDARQHGPKYSELLEGLLQYLRDNSAGLPDQRTAFVHIDIDVILEVLEQAELLVASGDYAAQSLLEQICSGLAKEEEVALAEEARLHYEDLELEAANVALQKLKLALQSRK